MTDDWEKGSAINSAESYKLAIDQLRVGVVMKQRGAVQLDGQPILHADGSPVRPGCLEEGRMYDIVPFEGGWRFAPLDADV